MANYLNYVYISHQSVSLVACVPLDYHLVVDYRMRPFSLPFSHVYNSLHFNYVYMSCPLVSLVSCVPLVYLSNNQPIQIIHIRLHSPSFTGSQRRWWWWWWWWWWWRRRRWRRRGWTEASFATLTKSRALAQLTKSRSSGPHGVLAKFHAALQLKAWRRQFRSA
jgi:hypothetical protein